LKDNVTSKCKLVRPFFGWSHTKTILQIFDATTHFAGGRVYDTLKRHIPVFRDTPAVDSGVTAAQIVACRESLVSDGYGLKTDKEFAKMFFRKLGAMDKLISDYCA
jgi:hypothetical protein